jgi:tetratricopeptide (TPR) repeat protein
VRIVARSGRRRQPASPGALVLILVMALAPGAALAAKPVTFATPAAPAITAPLHSADADAKTYERCMGLARHDPAAAKDLAERWRKRGGAHPADHCFAVALIGLKQYKEGATRLEALAQAMVHAPAALRAEVLDQASQAWLLAGDPPRAYAAQTAALKYAPNDPDLLIDRAEAAGEAGWFEKAIPDLDAALKADPRRADALIYRATAYRALGKLGPALADANAALRLVPNSVTALLERGNILRLKGDIAGARNDWQRVAALAPNSAAALAARANLAHLNQTPGSPPPTRH